jgi:hypothetical protein
MTQDLTPPIRRGTSPYVPLRTLEWPTEQGPPPKSWWSINERGELTKVYRSYEDYCDD